MDLGFIEVAIGVAIIILASGFVKYWMPTPAHHARRQAAEARGVEQPRQNQHAQQSPQLTAKALETYEHLAKEKLEVIKTALAMGYNDADLEKLDARLEKLVGKGAFEAILHGSGVEALATADLLDTQLDREADRLRSMRQPQR